jgi:hypothetical protein
LVKKEEEDDPAGWVVDGEKTPHWAAGGMDHPRPFGWCCTYLQARGWLVLQPSSCHCRDGSGFL